MPPSGQGGEEVLVNEDVFKSGGRTRQAPAGLRSRLSSGRTVGNNSSSSALARKKPLGIGDTVEAKFKNRAKYYKGTIEDVSGTTATRIKASYHFFYLPNLESPTIYIIRWLVV
jgi:hypothetical protein